MIYNEEGKTELISGLNSSMASSRERGRIIRESKTATHELCYLERTSLPVQ